MPAQRCPLQRFSFAIRADCDRDNVAMVKAFQRAGYEQIARRRSYRAASTTETSVADGGRRVIARIWTPDLDQPAEDLAAADPRMERLWSPAVAISGNRSQIARADERLQRAKTVAVG
jgi:hypothetical protein